MIRFLRALERALLWLGRFRLLRPLAVLLALVWMVDGFVRVATDAAWFASLGQEKLWRAQMAWQIGIAGAFGLLALGASVALMRAVARPAGTQVEPPLPRALQSWARARTRATRWGWAFLLLGIGTIARNLSERWPAFALSGARTGAGGGSWNQAGADFWVWHAPALAAGLDALWRFGLLLGLVAVGVGGLRSLPFLAARQSIVPRKWLLTLGTVALALLTLRAFGFTLEAARALWNLSNRGEMARFCEFALCIAGVLGCFACALSLRRPRPKVVLLLAIGVGLPTLLSDAVASRGLLSTPPDARATGERPRTLSPIALPGGFALSGISSPVRLEEGVSPAPKLSESGANALFQSGFSNASTHSLQPGEGPPAGVPVWDEATLLRVVRGPLERGQNALVEWQSAGVSARSDGAGAEIVGQAPLADAWAGHGLTGNGSELVWSSLDLPDLSPARHQPLGPLYYGLEARPLLSDDAHSGGVTLESWAWKLAWAWRLRDPLLLIEGAREQRLLAFRGARECGQKIAPFWLWDEAIPRRDPRTGSAVFECVAYAATSDLPDASPFSQGLFAGQNAVRPVAVLRMDGRDGHIQIAPFAASSEVPARDDKGNPFAARWARALPSLFDAPPQNAQTRALELARDGQLPLVWTPASGGWEERAVPPALQGAVSQKLGDFARTPRSRSVGEGGALEGATPALWKRGGKTLLARPYFALPPNEGAPVPVGQTPSSDGQTPAFRGFWVGELGTSSLGWGYTPEAAYAEAFSTTPPEAPRPPPTRSPIETRPALPLNTREAAREALAAWRAAQEAFKAGRYVESEQQSQRARQLLEPLTR